MNAQARRELLGPVRQVGYVVRDVEASAADWVDRLGVGPWRVRHGIAFDHCVYLDRSVEVEVSIASSYSNGNEVELIAQTGGDASMYSVFVEAGGPGAQHVCFYPADYDAARAHLLGDGMAAVLEGAIGGTRFAYFDDGCGLVVELADVASEGLSARARRAEAAAHWQGEQPLRF